MNKYKNSSPACSSYIYTCTITSGNSNREHDIDTGIYIMQLQYHKCNSTIWEVVVPESITTIAFLLRQRMVVVEEKSKMTGQKNFDVWYFQTGDMTFSLSLRR